jgi:hypothetical protein
MSISHGNSIENITLYPTSKDSFDSETPSWIEDSQYESIQPILALERAQILGKDTKYDLICSFMTYPSHNSTHPSLGYIMGEHPQENFSLEELAQQFDPIIPLDTLSRNHSTLVEIHPRKILNVNSELETSQRDQLIKVLQEHRSAFVRDQTKMKGIHPSLCTHHIYIRKYDQHVR